MATTVYKIASYASGALSWHGSKAEALGKARRLAKDYPELTICVDQATTAPGLSGKALLVAALNDSGWSDKAGWRTIWQRGPAGKIG